MVSIGRGGWKRLAVGSAVVLVAALALEGAPGVSASSRAVEAAETAPMAAVAGSDDERVSGAEAEAEARLIGDRVEVTAQRSARETVWANPDGTRTAELSAVPVRVMRGGVWADVDTTLVTGDDGRVVPRVAALGMSFSGGGSDVFAEFVTPRSKVGLGLVDAELPEPVLEANTATYPEVFPGVDLVVTVEVESFTHVWVVKDRAAANQPALRRLRMKVDAPGLELRSRAGGVELANAHGLVDVVAQRPVMWDARGEQGRAVAAERRSYPQTGDEIAPVTLSVEGEDGLVLEPDMELLTAPEAEFPVHIDPTWSRKAPDQGRWAMVFKEYPNMSFFKWGGTEGVGYQNYSGVSTKRLIWDFPASALHDTEIIEASFSAYMTHSASCTATRLNLYRTGVIGSGTTWNNQPNWIDYISQRTVAHGRDGCQPNGRRVEWDAKTAAEIVADRGLSRLALGLRAQNESDPLSWKRFRNDAILTVEYNTPPRIPDQLKTTSPSTSCVAGPERPLIGMHPPTLSARLRDPDGDHARAQFELYEFVPNQGWEYVWGRNIPRNDGGAQYRDPALGAYTTQVPAVRMKDATTYRWRVRAQDENGSWSAWSHAKDGQSWCQFRVDGQKPPAPDLSLVTPGQPYVGDTVEIRIEPCDTTQSGCSGDPDDVAVRYEWGLNDDGMPNVIQGASVVNGVATFEVTVSSHGPHTLYAHGYDEVGNVSDRVEMEVVVLSYGDPAAMFPMDEGAGTQTADREDPDRWLAWTGGVSWGVHHTPYEDDPMLVFERSGSASASTKSEGWDGSFTVAAWLRPDDLISDSVVLSQPGATGNGVELGVTTECPSSPPEQDACFYFQVQNQNGQIANVHSARSLSGWYYVAGVYNASQGELQLYVLDMDDPFVPPVEASTGGVVPAVSAGSLVVGADYLGAVDDVRVHEGPLDDSDIFDAMHEPED